MTRSGRTTIAPVTSGTPKQMHNERRRLEALSELAALGSAILEQGARRQRRQARNPDAEFYAAFTAQTKDAGKKGGLVVGSKHHYLRGAY